MGKPRITFVLASLRGGGAERVILTIARGIADKNYDVDLVLIKAEGEYLDQVPIQLRLVDLCSSSALKSIPKLVQYFRKELPSVIFPSLPHINLVTLVAKLLAGSRSRVVAIEHNTLSQSAHNASSLKGRSLPFFMRVAYPFFDEIIAVSNGVANDLAAVLKIPRKHLKVIYNPVVTPDMLSKAREDTDHPWFEEDSPPVILAVGRLTPAKGFPTLIRAFATVLENRAAKLIILGDGPDRANLQLLIQNLGITYHVDMPGFVNNPYVFFRKSTLFVLSSVWEGLPTVLIEALACGTSVISTDCPSGPREILQDGRWGTLVQVGEEIPLAKAIVESLDRPKTLPNESSWAPFSLENSISKYHSLLCDLLG